MMMNCKIERWQLQRDTVWIDRQTAGWTDGRRNGWLAGWIGWLPWIDASAYSIHMWHKAAAVAARWQQPQCQCMWHNFKYAAPEILLHWLHASTSRATRCDWLGRLSTWVAQMSGWVGWQFDLLAVGIQLTADGWCTTLSGHFTSSERPISLFFTLSFECPLCPLWCLPIILITLGTNPELTWIINFC